MAYYLTLCVILLSAIEDKICKTSSIDNYKPTGLASTVSKVLERILLDRLLKHVVTTDNQFGFKHKHGTDLCIHALKELVSKYKRNNSSMFM